MNERHIKALKLREAENTYAEIGRALGVSTGRARQIVITAERKVRSNKINPDWIKGLPTKLGNALIADGFKSLDEVRQALLTQRIGYVLGVGPESIKVLNKWLGLEAG